MAERFEKLFALPSNLYVEESPLVISAGSLLKDTQTGKIISQLKFQSVSKKNIKALKISIKAFDVSGMPLQGVDEYQYLDLSVCNGSSFGSDKAIIMPNGNCRSIEIGAIVVVFSDSTTWSGDLKGFKSLTSPQKIPFIANEELIKQYRIATTQKALYIPNEQKDCWVCTCGTINKDESCTNCHCSKIQVFSLYDEEKLTQAMDMRLQQESLERERIRLEQQKNAEKERIESQKRTKKIKTFVLITTPIVVALIAFIIVLTTTLIPNNHYKKGVELFNKGEYFEASCYFFKAKGYNDSEDYLIKIHRNTIAAGGNHTVGLKTDGTVVAVGSNEKGQCNISKWTNIVSIAAGYYHTVGLKSDGTVVAVGNNNDGQCNVSDWKDVVMVKASDGNTIALTSSGKILIAGDTKQYGSEYTSWTNIVDVAASDYHIVGLKSDGTVVACGWNDYSYRESDVYGWSNIVSIDADSRRTVGLKADGTLIANKKNDDGQNNISSWKNIVQVYGTYWDTIALKENGTVLAVGGMTKDCDFSTWKDIVAIAVDDFHYVGLKSNGTVVALGVDSDGRLKVNTWTNIDTDIININGK